MRPAGATGGPHPARVTYIGHGTVLIEMAGLRLLTDPALRRWVGPLLRRGPLPDGATLREIDAVLISHLHIDHLDVASLRLLGNAPAILVPAHGVPLLRRRGFERVVGMTSGARLELGAVAVTATEAHHSGRRGPARRPGQALGYVIHGPQAVYVAGDTGLFEGMTNVGAGPLDVACLPVSGWGGRLPDDHLNPVTAAQALRLLRPRLAVPIHWGTYYPPGLPEAQAERRRRAPRAFAHYAARLAPRVEVRVLAPGEGFDIPRRSGVED